MQRETDYFDYGHFNEFHECGVYGIKCKITNLEYVGSSSDIGRRFQKHFSELRYNRHTNKQLQIDFIKYGIENFEYYIIEKTNEFAKREIEIQIEKGIDKLYNEKIEGFYISEELRLVRSNSNKDSHKTDEYRLKMSNLKSNKILQLTMQGDMYKVYNNMKEVEEQNPTFKGQPIRGVCNGSKKSAYGYKWEYLKDL